MLCPYSPLHLKAVLDVGESLMSAHLHTYNPAMILVLFPSIFSGTKTIHPQHDHKERSWALAQGVFAKTFSFTTFFCRLSLMKRQWMITLFIRS